MTMMCVSVVIISNITCCKSRVLRDLPESDVSMFYRCVLEGHTLCVVNKMKDANSAPGPRQGWYYV